MSRANVLGLPRVLEYAATVCQLTSFTFYTFLPI